ncbi:MAG: DUF805 domain-containing protein, partial [Lentisphaeria bacterium]|nr:DUF805 domain-containing protein [Lentisphaeria bacterium]
LPSTTLTIRRLHDIGMSGFWILGWVIPVWNILLAIMLIFRDSEQGENQWGIYPK